MRRVLVVGAKEGSLGAHIAENTEFDCVTAGLHMEDEYLDVRQPSTILETLRLVRPTDIVVTAGVNIGEPIGNAHLPAVLGRSMDVNFIGVMNVLNMWMFVDEDEYEQPLDRVSFVAISSNSAHIARRNSMAYCASKAALSMGIRVAARELAGKPLVYGYEFGLLAGTPMSQDTEARFGPAQTRMVGAENGLSAVAAARQVCALLAEPWHGLNGSLLRLDAGEQ